MFSPNVVGSDETRKSIALPETEREIRPSWGARLSAMFIVAINLQPDRDRRPVVAVEAAIWRSTPSMR